MRRIAIWIASTVTILVLLFGYHTSTNRVAGADDGTAAGSSPQSTGTGAASSSPSASQPSNSSSTATKKPSTKQSFTGDAATTEWGPVQVKIIVSDKKITSVAVLQAPDQNPRDEQINSYALPILVQETISAQSADIDMISGATVTSDGYVRSLQSALDQAGI